MFNEWNIHEDVVFYHVKEYLKKSGDWVDVAISKNLLSDNDICFTILLKDPERTYMQMVGKSDFEALAMASYDYWDDVRMQIQGNSVNYIATPKVETARER